jgi:uncharacterized protein
MRNTRYLTAAFATLLIGCGSPTVVTAPAATATGAMPCPGGAAGADDGLDKLTDDQLARKILEVTGAGNLGQQVGDSMLETFSKMPNLPPGFVDRLRQNMHVEQLMDLIVPIYLRHYDRATMIAAIRFYQSDHGKVIVSGLPSVTAESLEAGKTWGAAVARKTLAELGPK